MCRVGGRVDEMSFMSKNSHRSVTALYSYSGLPYQVFICAAVSCLHVWESCEFVISFIAFISWPY